MMCEWLKVIVLQEKPCYLFSRDQLDDQTPLFVSNFHHVIKISCHYVFASIYCFGVCFLYLCQNRLCILQTSFRLNLSDGVPYSLLDLTAEFVQIIIKCVFCNFHKLFSSESFIENFTDLKNESATRTQVMVWYKMRNGIIT